MKLGARAWGRLAELPTLRFHRSLAPAVLLLTLTLQVGCVRRPPDGGYADMVIVGGSVTTVDPTRPTAEAVAVRDGRILEVGDRDRIAEWIGDRTEVVEARGGSVIPGFIEGHGHFLSLGRSLDRLALRGAESWQDVVDRVAERVREAKPGEWILGRGWHQDKWGMIPEPTVEGLPLHDALTAVSPQNPVVLTHASGHAVFVNGRAMELAGIGRATESPEGGQIVRDAAGDPIGVLRENASSLLAGVLPSGYDEDQIRRWVELASAESLSHGVTSFQDAGSSLEEIAFLRSLAENGELPLRLWMMVRVGNELLAENLSQLRVVGAGGDFFTVRAIKVALDGALGTHGAWLLEPYEDLPESEGLNTTSIASLEETARLAVLHDFQLCVHAIGDRANRETLDLYEEAFSEDPGRDRRWRIEHAQHLSVEDVPRFAELGVVASMQGVHCTSDGSWVPDRIGDRRARTGAYLWRSLLDSGALVSNGTDTPVEAVDPLASFHASVTRRLADGELFHPQQAMTREEALRSYTLNAATAAFEEEIKGSLTAGKLADIVILSADLMKVPEEEIRSLRVTHTILGGRLVYQASSEAR